MSGGASAWRNLWPRDRQTTGRRERTNSPCGGAASTRGLSPFVRHKWTFCSSLSLLSCNNTSPCSFRCPRPHSKQVCLREKSHLVMLSRIKPRVMRVMRVTVSPVSLRHLEGISRREEVGWPCQGMLFTERVKGLRRTLRRKAQQGGERTIARVESWTEGWVDSPAPWSTGCPGCRTHRPLMPPGYNTGHILHKKYNKYHIYIIRNTIKVAFFPKEKLYSVSHLLQNKKYSKGHTLQKYNEGHTLHKT